MSAVTVAILLMIGGIQPNPGPQDCVIGLLNWRSSVNKGAIIHDIIASINLSILAISETWILHDDRNAVTPGMLHLVTIRRTFIIRRQHIVRIIVAVVWRLFIAMTSRLSVIPAASASNRRQLMFRSAMSLLATYRSLLSISTGLQQIVDRCSSTS